MTDKFDESKFWSKVKKVAKVVGKEVLRPVLILYYTWLNPNTPAWAKAVIIAALIYFVCPIDAIPDVLVPVGYTDDAGVLAGACATVGAHIDETATSKADAKLRELFGE